MLTFMLRKVIVPSRVELSISIEQREEESSVSEVSFREKLRLQKRNPGEI